MVMPSKQGLDTCDLTGLKVHDRLVDESELPSLQGPLEVALEGEAGERRRVHTRLEDLDTVLAVALRRVHRDVRVAQQVVGGLAPGGRDRDPNAGMDEQLLGSALERRLEGCQ